MGDTIETEAKAQASQFGSGGGAAARKFSPCLSPDRKKEVAQKLAPSISETKIATWKNIRRETKRLRDKSTEAP